MAKIICGPEVIEKIPNACLGQIFYNALKSRCPNDVCLVDVTTGENIQTAQLLEDSIKLYHHLKGLHLDKSATVCVLAQNTWKTVVPFLSSAFACIPLHIVNGNAVISELKHFLLITRPSILFCYSHQIQNVIKLKKELKFIENVILLDDPDEIIMSKVKDQNVITISEILRSTLGDESFEPDNTDMSETILILNSSGTTGMPKCVMLTHGNLRFFINSFLDERFLCLTRTDNLVIFLPLCHIYGLYLLWSTLCLGTKGIVMNKFNGDLFAKAVKDFNVSKLFMVPPTVQYFAKVPLSESIQHSLDSKTIICGASILSKEVIDLVRKRYRVTIKQLYGMTECGIVITSLWDEPESESCGHLLAGVQVKIVQVGTNVKLPADQLGEVCVRGPSVMKGYMNDEINTREIIDSEGFLHTGDLGYYDENESIFITDRLKDIIKFKAYQVSPSQIEGLLMRHPAVKDVAVTSIPDEYAGDLPLALIVKQNATEVTEAEIIEYVRENMSHQSQLHGGVKFVDELPKTISGKILRRELRKLL